jgi:hypothetical protein
MCFSAEASFAGGAIISAIGIATVTKVHKPSQIVFACIPLFFGFQQITEGVLWLTIPTAEYIVPQKVVMFIFLIMALVIWPSMIPFSVLHMEESKKRKKILYALLILGGILSVYYAYCLVVYNVNPVIMGFHIQYNNDFPESLALISFIVYLIVTISPLFISSIKRTHLMGVLMTLSCLITGIFFSQYLTSVWCFFAALLSGVVYWILHDSRKKFNLDKLLLIKDQLNTIVSGISSKPK